MRIKKLDIHSKHREREGNQRSQHQNSARRLECPRHRETRTHLHIHIHIQQAIQRLGQHIHTQCNCMQSDHCKCSGSVGSSDITYTHGHLTWTHSALGLLPDEMEREVRPDTQHMEKWPCPISKKASACRPQTHTHGEAWSRKATHKWRERERDIIQVSMKVPECTDTQVVRLNNETRVKLKSQV